MPKSVSALILESGAAGGDLVYIRSAKGLPAPGVRLTTAPDLLGLKAEAVGLDQPLIAGGPQTDETYADVVIDADATEPAIVKAKLNGSPTSLVRTHQTAAG